MINVGIFTSKKVIGGFNSNYVNVVVEKIINGNLVQEVAEFIVEQSRGEGRSLILRNDNYEFIEELDFTKNDIISSLEETFKFRGESKEEKLKLINSRIEEQSDKVNNIFKGNWHKKVPFVDKPDEKKIKIANELEKDKKAEVKKFKIEKIQVNIIDEQRLLRLLEVLKQHIIDYDDNGVYEIINIVGLREIRFLLVEDFLYPLYRSPNNKTVYPNMVTKKKVYKVQHDLARSEFENATRSKINDFFKNALPIFVMALLLINIFFVYTNAVRGSKIDEEIHEGIKSCQSTLSTCNKRATEATLQSAFFITQYTKNNQDLISYASEQMHLLSIAMNDSVKKGTRKSNVVNTALATVINEAKS